MGDEERINTYERLFLQIKEDDNGIISAVSTRISAYVGSIFLCKKQMAKMFEPLKLLPIQDVVSELTNCLVILNDEKLNKIHGLNEDNTWNMSTSKVQSKVNQELAKNVGKKLIFQLSDGITTT